MSTAACAWATRMAPTRGELPCASSSRWSACRKRPPACIAPIWWVIDFLDLSIFGICIIKCVGYVRARARRRLAAAQLLGARRTSGGELLSLSIFRRSKFIIICILLGGARRRRSAHRLTAPAWASDTATIYLWRPIGSWAWTQAQSVPASSPAQMQAGFGK